VVVDQSPFEPMLTEYLRLKRVQELLLAKSMTILLSGTEIEWTKFGKALARSAAERVDVRMSTSDTFDENTALKLFSFWHDRWGDTFDPRPIHTQHATVWELIHMHKRARCTDQRDRIYSLLGLLDRGHDFAVNYDESAADLFWRAGEHFNAWETSELIDTLRVALLQSQGQGPDNDQSDTGNVDRANPLILMDSLKTKPDLQIRIPIRRAWPTTSLICRLTRRVKCKFEECHSSPKIQCTRNDVLLCTNAPSYSYSEHGCIHALASPTDKPAAERFKITLIAHHGKKHATTVLPPTALQVFDRVTDTWIGVSTWSSLRKGLERRDLDRADHVKLLIPARYAVWIWFGVHPNHLDDAYVNCPRDLPSAHHVLPPGTKITRDSIEVPPIDPSMDGETHAMKESFFK
jgi:hypothetical protein